MQQKSELIAQLYSSKGTLELQAESQAASLAKMQETLNELDKTNRKLADQECKANTQVGLLKQQIGDLNGKLNEMKVVEEKMR